MLKLCTDALETVVPSSSTESKTAIGLINPVLEVVYAPDVTFDFDKIIARKNKTVRKLVAGINSTMQAHNIQVVKGEAHIKGRTEEAIEIYCNDETFQTKNLLLCTGSETFISLSILGSSRSGVCPTI